MSTRCVALIASLAGLMFLADSASAGIFGRRWERRRAELYGSLNASLAPHVGRASGRP